MTKSSGHEVLGHAGQSGPEKRRIRSRKKSVLTPYLSDPYRQNGRG